MADDYEQMYDIAMVMAPELRTELRTESRAELRTESRAECPAADVSGSVVAELEAVKVRLDQLVGGLVVGVLTGSEALALLRAAVGVRNTVGVIESMASARVAETSVWRGGGARSAEVFLARQRGASVADTVASVDTARRMADLPAADEAWRAGRLSGPQAAAVASAASQRPEAERSLVDAAAGASLGGLRRACGEALAKGVGAEERERRVHARRSVTHREHVEGGFEMVVRGTHASLATIRAGLATTHERVFQQARRDGRHERADAHLFDALELLCADAVAASRSGPRAAGRPGAPAGRVEGGSSGGDGSGVVRRPAVPASKVIVRVDHAALMRGYPLDGELCEVSGVGPIPVAAVRDAVASGDPFLAAVVTDGVDVQSVVHLGRRPTSVQQTALEFTNPVCSRADCGRSARLEADHRLDWHHTRHTRLDELDLLCGADHDLKTHQGWRLEPGRGVRRLLAPDELARQLPARVVAGLYTPDQLARFQPEVAARLVCEQEPGTRATSGPGPAPDSGSSSALGPVGDPGTDTS